MVFCKQLSALIQKRTTFFYLYSYYFTNTELLRTRNCSYLKLAVCCLQSLSKAPVSSHDSSDYSFSPPRVISSSVTSTKSTVSNAGTDTRLRP